MDITVLAEDQKDLLADLVPSELLIRENMAICALKGENIIGCMILSQASGRICDIPFIYVVPAGRKRKTAKKMLAYAASLVKANGISALSMNYIEESEDDILSVFAKASGFEEVNSSNLYEIGLSDALESVHSARALRKLPPATAITLSEMTNKQWNELVGSVDDLRKSSHGEDVYDIPYPKNYYDGDLSLMATDVAGIPWGVVLCRNLEDCVNIEYLCSLKPQAQLSAPILIRELCQKLSEHKETTIRFHAFNPKVEKLVAMSLGENAKVSGKFVSWLYYV